MSSRGKTSRKRSTDDDKAVHEQVISNEDNSSSDEDYTEAPATSVKGQKERRSQRQRRSTARAATYLGSLPACRVCSQPLHNPQDNDVLCATCAAHTACPLDALLYLMRREAELGRSPMMSDKMWSFVQKAAAHLPPLSALTTNQLRQLWSSMVRETQVQLERMQQLGKPSLHELPDWLKHTRDCLQLHNSLANTETADACSVAEQATQNARPVKLQIIRAYYAITSHLAVTETKVMQTLKPNAFNQLIILRMKHRFGIEVSKEVQRNESYEWYSIYNDFSTSSPSTAGTKTKVAEEAAAESSMNGEHSTKQQQEQSTSRSDLRPLGLETGGASVVNSSKLRTREVERPKQATATIEHVKDLDLNALLNNMQPSENGQHTATTEGSAENVADEASNNEEGVEKLLKMVTTTTPVTNRKAPAFKYVPMHNTIWQYYDNFDDLVMCKVAGCAYELNVNEHTFDHTNLVSHLALAHKEPESGAKVSAYQRYLQDSRGTLRATSTKTLSSTSFHVNRPETINSAERPKDTSRQAQTVKRSFNNPKPMASPPQPTTATPTPPKKRGRGRPRKNEQRNNNNSDEKADQEVVDIDTPPSAKPDKQQSGKKRKVSSPVEPVVDEAAWLQHIADTYYNRWKRDTTNKDVATKLVATIAHTAALDRQQVLDVFTQMESEGIDIELNLADDE